MKVFFPHLTHTLVYPVQFLGYIDMLFIFESKTIRNVIQEQKTSLLSYLSWEGVKEGINIFHVFPPVAYIEFYIVYQLRKYDVIKFSRKSNFGYFSVICCFFLYLL